MSEPLKVGDKVQVISGPDEGRVGKVTRLFDDGIVVCKFGHFQEHFHASDLVLVSAIQHEPEPSTDTLLATNALIDRIKYLEADRGYWQGMAKAKLDAAISLRDHFAGLAMSGWMANIELSGFEDHYIAGKAYQIADAMLKARA